MTEVGTVGSTSRPTSHYRRPAVAPGFRSDVEGLRAVAVGLVLLYHAGLHFVPGGFVVAHPSPRLETKSRLPAWDS